MRVKKKIYKLKKKSWKYAHYFVYKEEHYKIKWWSLCWQANGVTGLGKSFDTTEGITCPICERRLKDGNMPSPITVYVYVSHELDRILGLI